MEFIRFVLSGFWTWAGFLILIVAAGNAVAEIIKAACPCRKIEAYRIGDRWHVQIEGARRGDIAETLKAAERDDETGATVVLLIPARTDTAYFHDYIYGKAEIRFIRGRLRFTDEEGNAYAPAPFPSMVVIYNGKGDSA